MAEQRRSKAREVVEHLYESAATRAPEEKPHRPQMQLRRDMPAVEVGETTPVVDALAQLQAEHIGTLALRTPDGDAKAVVLSVEQYLDFVGRELERHAPGVATNGRIMLSDAGLKPLHVEQVDPTEPWQVLPTQVIV
jgi:hypothetical protein